MERILTRDAAHQQHDERAARRGDVPPRILRATENL
jgi:hypothetical protein